MKPKSLLQVSILWSLIYVMVITPCMDALAQALQEQKNVPSAPILDEMAIDESEELGLSPEIAELSELPVSNLLRQASNDYFEGLDLKFSTGDSLLDQHPYFLDSQSWTTKSDFADVSASDFEFDVRRSHGKVEVAITAKNETLATWSLKFDAGKAIETPDYLIFTAADKNLFEEKSRGLDSVSQGVFFVSKDELLTNVLSSKVVPVFFFPMMSGNWTGDVKAMPFPNLETILLLNSELEAAPIHFSQLAQIASVQRNNLMFAMIQKLRDLPEQQEKFAQLTSQIEQAMDSHVGQSGEALLELQKVFASTQSNGQLLPAPGSTAGFGLLFTGMDLSNPSSVPLWKGTSLGGRKSVFEKLFDFVMPSAYAQASPYVALLHRMVHLGITVGIAVTASIIAYQVKYKYRYYELREKEFKRTGVRPEGVGQAVKENLSLVAASLGILRITPQALPGNAAEFFFDRLMPRRAAAENSWVRQFLKQYYFKARNQSRNLPSNHNTLFQGAIVLGGIDTGWVAAQEISIIPHGAMWTGGHFPKAMPYIDNAFGVNNPAYMAAVIPDVIRNEAAWLTNGALKHASSARNQQLEIFGPRIDAQMRSKGYDMTKQESKDLLEAKVEEEVEKVMRKLGLPTKDQFMYDFFTLYSSIQAGFGWVVPKESRQAGKYTLEDRPGLSIPAVNRAIAAIQKDLAEDPGNPELTSALKLMQELQGHIGYFRNFILNPINYIADLPTKLGPSIAKIPVKLAVAPFELGVGTARAVSSVKNLKETGQKAGQLAKRVAWGAATPVTRLHEARRLVVALSYEGPKGADLSKLPSQWLSRFGELGMQTAGTYLRRSIDAYRTGRPEILDGLAPEEAALVQVEASAKALEELRARHEADKDLDREALVAKFKTEYRLIEEATQVALRDEKTAPPKVYAPKEAKALMPSKFVQRQMRALEASSNLAFRELNDRAFDPVTASTEDRQQWRRLFGNEYMRMVGLYANYDYEDNLAARAKERADVSFKEIVESDGFRRYLEGIEPAKQEIEVARIYAETRVGGYLASTVSSSDVSPLSPAQPGFFQNWRQSILSPKEFREYQDFVEKQERLSALRKLKKSDGWKVWRQELTDIAVDTYRIEHAEWIAKTHPELADLMLKYPEPNQQVVEREDRIRFIAAIDGDIEGLEAAIKDPTQTRRNFGKVLKTRLIRSLEATLPSDEYGLGLWPKLSRIVPFLYDTWQGVQISMNSVVPGLTFGYFYNRLAFGATMPFSYYTLFLLTVFCISGPDNFVNRLVLYQKWQPVNSFRQQVIVGNIYAWATFIGGVIVPLIYFNGFAEHFYGSIIYVLAAAGAILFIPPEVRKNWIRIGIRKVGELGRAGIEIVTEKVGGVFRRERRALLTEVKAESSPAPKPKYDVVAIPTKKVEKPTEASPAKPTLVPLGRPEEIQTNATSPGDCAKNLGDAAASATNPSGLTGP